MGSLEPLSLVIYPKSVGRHGETLYTDLDGEWMLRDVDVDDILSDTVRLSDAELAAETYRQLVRAVMESGIVMIEEDVLPGDGVVFGPVRRETYRLGVLKRFTTLDNASDKDYQ